MNPSVPLIPSEPELQPAAQALAARYGLPCVERSDAPYQLWLEPGRLALHQTGEGAPGPVFVDFVAGALGHRRRFGGGRGQPLARAVGLKGGASPRVIDATGGLGGDAFVLACLGCPVTLIERSPVVAALLDDGLRRAAADAEVGPIVARMHLHRGDARHLLAELPPAEVVYLDPMFPPRRKSAQVKKGMALFHELVGRDEDAGELLAAALARALKRVVVKRPLHPGPLAGPAPSMQVKGKKHRYDVYVIAALKR